MKKTLKYLFILTVTVGIFVGCKRDDDYHFKFGPVGFISNYDLKRLDKGADVTLNAEALGGATTVVGVVISDFRLGNSPAGLLVMQNSRITNGPSIDSLRGMAFNIGTDASKYIPGDSIHVKIQGGTMKRVNGVLQITGLPSTAVTKISAGARIKLQAGITKDILANPNRYESTLVAINNAAFDPEPAIGTTYSGDKIINDGFGVATLHTETTAAFASTAVQPSGNFTGIPFISGTGASKKITYWMRSPDDFFYVPQPKLSAAVISGFMVDPNGNDYPYEYVQLLAARDIDFAVTPMSMVTNNNAGATTFPAQGWATGGVRTYKINITSGTVKKGEFFYVGGSGRRINGSASTAISSSKWIIGVDYSTATGSVGADGIGDKTNNLLANSGNVAGIALFEGTTVNASTVPLDVIFYGGPNGNYYTAGPPEAGYRITITDLYSIYAGKVPQEYYGKGTNTARFAGFTAATSFARLGGVYKAKKGGWDAVRAMVSVPLTNASVLSDIETGATTTLVDK
jgi:hypothetical protein